MQKSLAQEGAQAGDLVERLRTQVREKDATVGEYTTLLQTAKQDVARLTEELKKRDDESVKRNLDDERNMFGIKEQLAERDKEIFGLRKALDKAEDDAKRSKPAGAADTGMVAKMEELKESVQDYRARADAAEKKLGAAEKRAKDAEEAARLAKKEAADAQAAMEQAASSAAAGGTAGSRESEREIQRLKTELKRAQRDTRGGPAVGAAGADGGDDGEVEKLKEEVAKLKKDLRAAEQAAAGAGGAAAAAPAPVVDSRKTRELEEEVQRLKREVRDAKAAAAAGGGGGDGAASAASAAAERELKAAHDEVKRLKRDLERAEAKAASAGSGGAPAASNGVSKEKLQKFHDTIGSKAAELRGALRNLQNHMLTLKDVIESHPGAKKAVEDDDLLGQLEFEIGNIEENAKATRDGLNEIKTELDK
jgi:predicted  nucleic acid-binding Zn-ribbon protein